MLGLVDNKLSKSYDHDIASRIIDSMRAEHRISVCPNVADKSDVESISELCKMERDSGNTIDLVNLLPYLAG